MSDEQRKSVREMAQWMDEQGGDPLQNWARSLRQLLETERWCPTCGLPPVPVGRFCIGAHDEQASYER